MKEPQVSSATSFGSSRTSLVIKLPPKKIVTKQKNKKVARAAPGKSELAKNRVNGRLIPKNLKLLTSGNKIPVIKFEPPTSLKVTPNKDLIELETRVNESTPNHVDSCTCPGCKKAKYAKQKFPIVLKYKAGIKLIESTMEFNGFLKTTKDDWNLIWIAGSAPVGVFQTLTRFQKINQFPRTYEITRKDTLCRNIVKMQQLHGKQNFDFLPESFVLPAERPIFEEHIRKLLQDKDNETMYEKRKNEGADRSPLWIVKPANMACGRGIFVTSNIGEIPMGGIDDSSVCVSRYINNPMLLDGRKFDLRIYVSVTSFVPLRIFIHDEGLVRLTTEQYSNDPEALANRFVHLTNYSVQKTSQKFVQNNGNQEPMSPNSKIEQDEKSSKWSLQMFRQRLERMGVDSTVVFGAIEEVAIKTIISIEPQVVSAIRMSVPFPESCFQMFGFDILLDSDFKPWLLEVNLSPSLSCDSALDMSIKSKAVTQLLTLAGVHPCEVSSKSLSVVQSSARTIYDADQNTTDVQQGRASRDLATEKLRSQDWKCIYPNSKSFMYSKFFAEPRAINEALIKKMDASNSTKTRLMRKFSKKNKIAPLILK